MTTGTVTLPTYRMLGVGVNAIDVDTLFRLIEEAIATGGRHVIANHNLHSVYLHHYDARMRRFYQLANHVFVDGTPMIYLGRLLGHPLSYRHRITSIHWIRPLLARGVRAGWRTYLLGGKPGTASNAAGILAGEIPGAQIESDHGYFDPTPGHPQAEAVLQRIARYRPHILCLGMGMPRQEQWILDHYDRIEANVILNLGGFMELITGELPTPPRWVGRVNLEWLYRLATRPRRVWRRYLVEPWYLTPWLARDLVNRARGR
jgi:N-acetylglucosaminyldiphosphoundecaprenol N-acetyl-beta-D-mannosaminyltransferase